MEKAIDTLEREVPREPDVFDAIASVDRVIAGMTGMRARLIEQAYQWIASEPAAISARKSSTRSSEPDFARALLVAELAPLLRVSPMAASRLVDESRALASTLPLTLEALGNGDITYAHAAVVVDQAESLPTATHGEFESVALKRAGNLSGPRFKEHARRLRERLHPESVTVRRRIAAEGRHVRVEPARDGMAWFGAYIPAEAAIAADDRLDQLAAAIRNPDDPRTFAQLRADVFCELLISGESSRDDTGLPRGIQARVLVAVPVLNLLGETDEPATMEGYGPISDDVARLLAAKAPSFIRILTHPETGAVLSVGRDRYVVPADLRLWARLRDEFCRGLGCGRRAATCDVDHGHAWADGGGTDYDNVAHLCRGDHTRKHRLGWQMEHLPGGTIRWTSPFGRTYLTEPSIVMQT
jgi:hypothetical protein